MELTAAVLLGIAGIATSWSGYQSARWGGTQATLFAKAGALRVESARRAGQANAQRLVDINLFVNWLDATASEQSELATFLRTRFRDEFAPAFDAWLATEPLVNPAAPAHPFELPAYRLALEDEAQRLETEAGQAFADGEKANEWGDAYILTTVIFATVLFLAGISQHFVLFSVRLAVLIVAGALCMLGIYRLIALPIN
jgi:hypothetical protein